MSKSDDFIGEMFSAILKDIKECNHCSRYYNRISVYFRDLYNGISWNEHDTEVVENCVCEKHRREVKLLKRKKEA